MERKKEMKEAKPLKDCFKCCVCLEAAGFMPNGTTYTPRDTDTKDNITQPLMCKRCDSAFTSWRSRYASVNGQGATMLDILDWVAKRARAAEHRRMADKVNGLELKLRVEIATTNAIIRKYGTTTTEIGDMNAK
jgi:hypothetical protein